jgi:hypothetical protein
LLKALVNAISSGEFHANVEEIRSECQARKCYDTNNWNNNFQNNATLFDFGKYTKDLKMVRLSEDGKKELAALLRIAIAYALKTKAILIEIRDFGITRQ